MYAFCFAYMSFFNHQMKKGKNMGYLDLFLIGVGLSMDAFAVSICKGLKMKKVNKVHCLVIALFFGGFQALMPFLGWALGRQFEKYITSIDHWIAFVLLAFLGGKMVVEALKKDEGEEEDTANGEKLDLWELFLLAIATSIDALAVGITFAFLQVSIVPAITIIGCTTFVLSIIAVYIGNIFGAKYKNRAELAGGIILILIGLRILLEHLGII
jgi:putative Mn2+ efflux pump MntP